MSCGAVVSDLHLFTNRTNVHEHMADIREAADHCDLFVFNGDIFDFQWSLHDGYEDSVKAAAAWIRRLAGAHPGTRFVFILGNHDSIPAYRDALARLCREESNLEWHADWYRLGSSLFLHGDVYHTGEHADGLTVYRARCNRSLRRSRIRHACYWAFSVSGIPPLLLRFVSRKRCARRIMAYLSTQLGSGLDGVRDIYFGHVHTPFSCFRYGHVLFHNTGAAIRGMRLRVLRFPL